MKMKTFISAAFLLVLFSGCANHVVQYSKRIYARPGAREFWVISSRDLQRVEIFNANGIKMTEKVAEETTQREFVLPLKDDQGR